jgi:hypothetical protein
VDFDQVCDEEWRRVILSSKDFEFHSFSLKMLLGKLRIKLDLYTDLQTFNNCLAELKTYINSYIGLPNVQEDLKRLFNLEVD